MKHMLVSCNDNRVPGVCSAACPGNHIEVLSNDVCRFPFPLIPPLGSDDRADLAERVDEGRRVTHGSTVSVWRIPYQVS